MKISKHHAQFEPESWNRFSALTILADKRIRDGITEILQGFIDDDALRERILQAPASEIQLRQGKALDPAEKEKFTTVEMVFDRDANQRLKKFLTRKKISLSLAEIVRRRISLLGDLQLPRLPSATIKGKPKIMSINNVREDVYRNFRAACALHDQTLAETINGTLKNLDGFRPQLAQADTAIYEYAGFGSRIPDDERKHLINTRIKIDQEAHAAAGQYAAQEGVPATETIRRVIGLASLDSPNLDL